MSRLSAHYKVGLPKRFESSTLEATTVRIGFRFGEHLLVIRERGLFARFRGFASDELRAIADKLDDLNKEGA